MNIKTVNRKINQICRACRNKNKATKMQIIFNGQLPAIYESLTSLEISPGDGLPQVICVPCKDMLEYIQKFKQQCIETHKYLMDQFNHIDIKTEADFNHQTVPESCQMIKEDYFIINEQDEQDIKVGTLNLEHQCVDFIKTVEKRIESKEDKVDAVLSLEGQFMCHSKINSLKTKRII